MAIGLAVDSLTVVLLVNPHHFAYFNDSIAGPRNGWRLILGRSFDWGQDLPFQMRVLDTAPEISLAV